MFSKVIISTVALLAVVNAIKVTSPGQNTEWNSKGSQTISWEAVSTDPDSFKVILDNQSGFLDNAPVTLIQEQSTGDANSQMSATVSFPNGDWPTGYGFQINLVSTDRNNNAILAQSQQFNITSSGGDAGGSTSAMSMSTMTSSTVSRSMTTPTTMSRSSTTTAAGSIPSGNGDASGGIPGSSTSSTAPNGASNLALPALPFLGALAALFL